MITAHFSDCFEVRMGSPFQMCRLRLEGEWTPNLDELGWLPLCSHSPDGRYLGLVEWDTAKNVPRFRVVVVDMKLKTVERSESISGCCESISLSDSEVFWKAFPGSQGSIALPLIKPAP